MDFFKKLFSILFSSSESSPNFGTGALESPADVRNISLASFQAPVELPDDYETPLPPVEDQGAKSNCVGQAIHKIAELLMSSAPNYVDLSADDLYEQCKAIDGIPNALGTYPSVGAKVACNSGIATVEAYQTGDILKIRDSRAKHKLSGYAFVEPVFEAVVQAIFQNKAITASFAINSKWFSGKIIKVLSSIGRHYVVLNGFTISKREVRGQNSWGVKWIGYIAGLFNEKIKPGCFEFDWKDYEQNVIDLIAFTFIPAPILDPAKDKEYRFNITLRRGDTGYEVTKLQERLTKEDFPVGKIDGDFGSNTFFALKNYQVKNGLVADGIFGPSTREFMNKKAETSITKWALAIQTHEGYLNATQYPPNGSRSFRNNSPANFKLVGGVLTEYMKKLGATGLDAGGFVKFPAYEVGFKALCTFLMDACNDKLTSYKGTMTLLQFFQKYAPSSDNNDPLRYAQTVAKKVGATVDTQIKNLL